MVCLSKPCISKNKMCSTIPRTISELKCCVFHAWQVCKTENHRADLPRNSKVSNIPALIYAAKKCKAIYIISHVIILCIFPGQYGGSVSRWRHQGRPGTPGGGGMEFLELCFGGALFLTAVRREAISDVKFSRSSPRNDIDGQELWMYIPHGDSLDGSCNFFKQIVSMVHK